MKRFSTIAIIFVSLNAIAQQAGVVTLSAEKLHARVREWPYPINDIVVPTNAPALLWPATNGKSVVLPMESGSDVPEDPDIGNVRYQVVLATDNNFTKDLIRSGVQAWAVYPLHQALKPGRWYWKYGYSLKSSSQWVWSPVYTFRIDSRYKNQIVSPPVSEVLKRNEGSHPRLWKMYEIADDFYRKNIDNPEAKSFIAYAEKLMKEPLPVEKPMRMIDTTGKTDVEKKIIQTRMYHGFGDAVGDPVSSLCIAYQLSRDKKFIEDARRRALNLLRMDPNGLATGDDFTGGAVLEALGWFYDAGYEILTEKERQQFRDMIRLRAKRVYDHLPNRFEVHVSDNHVWQITLRNLAIATVAVAKEVPEANEWLTYLYEVWSARFPVLGTTDGGWHEGNGYFKVNFKSIIYLSQLFGGFTGVDYFKFAWMQHLPYYMLYTWPPASATTAYGDMWENAVKMVRAQALFADALTYKINNPFLEWYVSENRKNNPELFNRSNDEYLFFRLLNHKAQPQNKTIASPDQLPKLRLFADVGVCAMHSDLAHPAKNISVYLMSNPFGASGHGSASQNAFTLNLKGKTIFGGSGYYGNFSDRHNLLYYRTSRAYSTILADSLSQKIGEEGYGWIPRAISGSRIQYALGDASNAYGNITSEFWLNRFRQIKVNPVQTRVYGDKGVSLYRRHLLHLDGGIIVLYDELEAKQPIKWTNQFHAPYYMIKADPTQNTTSKYFTVDAGGGKVGVAVFANVALTLNVHDKFSEPAVNWAKVIDGDGNIKEFKDQWHAGVTSPAANRFRFLTIIQVKEGRLGIISRFNDAKNTKGLQRMKVGNWEIIAQLDGARDAALQVKDGSAAFDYGGVSVDFQGKKYQHRKTGSSMLIELQRGKVYQSEETDRLPDVAKYDIPHSN